MFDQVFLQSQDISSPDFFASLSVMSGHVFPAHDTMSFKLNRRLFAVTSLWQKSSEPWHYVICVSSHFELKSMGFESVNGSRMHRDNNFHYCLQDLLRVKETKWSRLKVVKCLFPNTHIGTYTVWYQNERNVVLLYCTLCYYTVLYCIILYCIFLYCIPLYCTVLHSIILYITVLYWIVQ